MPRSLATLTAQGLLLKFGNTKRLRIPGHFTSPQYTALLLAQEVQISMDSKGRAIDNIFTERLWRSVKYEEVYLHDYAAPRDAHQGLARYFTFYNHERLHQALGYTTPASWFYPVPDTPGI